MPKQKEKMNWPEALTEITGYLIWPFIIWAMVYCCTHGGSH